MALAGAKGEEVKGQEDYDCGKEEEDDADLNLQKSMDGVSGGRKEWNDIALTSFGKWAGDVTTLGILASGEAGGRRCCFQ